MLEEPKYFIALSINNDNFFIITIVLSVIFFVLSAVILILLKNRKILFRGIKLTIFDLVVVVMGSSIFIMGICGGYILSRTLFPNGLVVKENVNDISNKDDLTSKDNITDENKSLEFNYDEESLLLYEKPNDDAKVIYEIKEDLNMEVIDQAAGWYRIILENGIHGWVKIDKL